MLQENVYVNNSQVTQGALQQSNPEVNNQSALGALDENQQSIYQTTTENFDPILLNEIQPFTHLPDFKNPTISQYPTIIKTSDSFYCIDGYELVLEARSKSESEIRCLVFHVSHYSDIELSIRKTAIRSVPQGGNCSYAELARNAKLIFRMLIATSENPIVYSHGGARSGADYTNNKEDDIRKLLAYRLGKTRKVISSYLRHGFYINDDQFDYLINKGATKKFFEAMMSNVNTIETELMEAEKSPEEITEAISEKVRGWYEAFVESKGKKIPSVLNETEQPADDAGNNDNEDEGTTPGSFSYPSPPDSPDNAIITEDALRNEINNLLNTLHSGTENENFDTLLEIIETSVTNLADILQKGRHLQSVMQSSSQGGE